jgi:hypothetical protein
VPYSPPTLIVSVIHAQLCFGVFFSRLFSSVLAILRVTWLPCTGFD